MGETNSKWRNIRVEYNRFDSKRSSLLHIDLILAHLIYDPILTKFGKDINLWRFHRRADDGIARFTFSFYSTEDIKNNIIDIINRNPIYQEFIKKGLINKYTNDDLTSSNIEEIGEKYWSLENQKVWPPFIMSLSKMWLDLIKIIHENNLQKQNCEISEPIDYYKEIDQRINHLWTNEGQDVLLHHINAIFEYGFVKIIPRASQTNIQLIIL